MNSFILGHRRGDVYDPKTFTFSLCVRDKLRFEMKSSFYFCYSKSAVTVFYSNSSYICDNFFSY